MTKTEMSGEDEGAVSIVSATPELKGHHTMPETAVINLSEDLYLALCSFGLTKERIASESKQLLAMKYFREKLLSLGKAAELAGLSKWDFIEYLGANNVAAVD